MPEQVLAVIGAGPKATAVAAKHAALAAVGLPVPELVVLDPLGVAAHWDGAAGYTDGQQRLGTPPAKDLGYPYAPSWGAASDAVAEQMCGVSWPSYLAVTGRYADWVDRGQLHPTHGQWAGYVRWVADRVRMPIHRARLAALGVDGGRWNLDVDGADGPRRIVADGVLITGPGPARRLPGQPQASPRVLDGRTVWSRLADLRDERPRSVAVVGAGETAAAATVALAAALPSSSRIEVITSDGVLHTRGESHTENALYSDPGRWQALPERARRAFLRGTDRGVFSVAAQRELDAADAVHTVIGRCTGITEHPDQVVLNLDEGAGEAPVAVTYDVVVVCTGFDPLWWLALDDGTVADGLERAGIALDPDATTQLERAVEPDLTVRGLPAPLHLPMLAGLAQGPGFPNLSCLGLLADRVLHRYVRPLVPVDSDRAAVPA